VIARLLTVWFVGWLSWSTSIFGATPGEDVDIALPADLDALLVGKPSSHFSYGGYLKNETAYRFDEPRSFTKIRNIFSINAQYEFGKHARFHASGWAYYDLVYDLFDYETIAARSVRDEKEPLVFLETLLEEKDSPVAEFREVYADFFFDKLDVRIGRQFIIWGVLEGVRVVDEINPMNFRELILPDMLDYRIPLWSAKADVYWRDATFELLWIPDLTFHQPAPEGSEWELFKILPRTTKPKSFDPKESEWGAKVTFPFKDATVSLSYFYTWDDYPVTFRVISQEDLRFATPSSDLAVFPTYTRMSMYGATFTKEIRGDILKGEIALVTGKYFAIVDVDENKDFYLDSDGEEQRNHIRWGLGYDFSLWGADIAPSMAQWIILDYNSHILFHQYDTTFNVFIRKPLRKRSAVFTLLLIQLINFNETLIKPKVTFNLTDHFQVITGMDLFMGDRTAFGRATSATDPGGLVDIAQRAQFLGNFRDNRRVFVEFKYNF